MSEAAQANRNRERRERFLREYGAIDAAEAARGQAGSADERAARVRSWIRSQQAFSVIHEGRELLPSFQFDPATGALRPQVAQLLEALGGKRHGWEIALWMISPNGWLRGERPIELWTGRMGELLETARREVSSSGM